MASSKLSGSYRYEFISSVPDYLYCKKCTLVARKLNITTCCGESFCHVCITDLMEESKPCPSCGEKDYKSVGQVKNQKQIASLEVYCSMKERGCEWSGMLEQLDTHLDPDQDNCQYVDTECPLRCLVAIPKNKVEQHVAQHCTKRPYVCQHCNFKATYEEVVDKHLAECKYVPLQCPNMCGVTFERDFLGDHMKICRLEKVMCTFRGVGCKDQFTREGQEEHARQNSQKHLTLTASVAIETKEQLQQKLLEQDKTHKEEVLKLKEKIQEQENKIEEQVEKLAEQENKLDELEKELKGQKADTQNITQHSEKMKERLEMQHKEIQNLKAFSLCLNQTVTMTEFSKAKRESAVWNSPAMYTHVCGYKFFIQVHPNGKGDGQGKAVHIQIWSTNGEYDSQLKWPTPKFKITLELINQNRGDNFNTSIPAVAWSKPDGPNYVKEFGDYILSRYSNVIYHSNLNPYLHNDTLSFNVHTIVL